MYNEEPLPMTTSSSIQFHLNKDDQELLANLPWQYRLEEWIDYGIALLSIRHGESRHPVVFVELDGKRYAIKETTPRMAEREIANLHEIERRGIPTLSPAGSVVVHGSPILLEEYGPNGVPEYISGDRGYTVTQLAPRVIPQVLLNNIPFTRKTKHTLFSAIALLLVELHEHGIYWGDPSLANVLMRIDGRRVLAIMADAETAELFPAPVSDEMREQDLETLRESLLWQAEDLRQARGLSEDEELIDDKDFRYLHQKYHVLRREHSHFASSPNFSTLYQVQYMLETLNQKGFALLGIGGHALQQFATVLPGWYIQRIHDLLGITVPRAYARHFYNTLLGHQAMLSKKEQREVSLEEAAQDWYTRYHLPAILLLRRNLTSDQDPMKAYFEIMERRWKMSLKAGYEIPIEEATLAWAMQEADTGKLGVVDPATLATWWRDRLPATEVLEPSLIEPKTLEPLLSKEEKPLVHLPTPELDQKLTQILDQQKPEEEEHEE